MGIAACGSKIRSDPGRYTAAKVRSMHVMQSNSPTVLFCYVIIEKKEREVAVYVCD